MTDYASKPERAAIDKAAAAIKELSASTNWTDGNAWAEALKLERKQGLPPILAKGKAIEAWHKGASDVNTPVREMYHMRPGYLAAYLLGVRHAVERADRPLFRDALDACPAAMDAYNSAAARWAARWTA